MAYCLKDVIKKTKGYLDDILVVDDGSTDGTADIAWRLGVDVISHSINRGKGAALKAGFRHAIEHGYDAVITLDSDGQHDPKYIPEFLAAHERFQADLIIGSRMRDKADMPFDRRCSNYLTSRSLSLLLGRYIEDSQSGYRLISARLLKSISLKSDRFQLETEIIIKAAQAGFKIGSVPIKVIYGREFPSSIHRFIDTFRWVQMVLEEI
ncbi:MAG: glycosyltransferase family 2 protein [candidate division Zixibacteria bacterium]|nr:glycosyltransferase family 2 protein [candidate division Zixibacteria bacterium]